MLPPGSLSLTWELVGRTDPQSAPQTGRDSGVGPGSLHLNQPGGGPEPPLPKQSDSAGLNFLKTTNCVEVKKTRTQKSPPDGRQRGVTGCHSRTRDPPAISLSVGVKARILTTPREATPPARWSRCPHVGAAATQAPVD